MAWLRGPSAILCAALALLAVHNVPALAAPPPAIYSLGSLGGTSSVAYSINPGGQIAGSSLWSGGAGNHAFLYAGTPGADGQMTDLGSLGGTKSGALGINSAGNVVGYTFAGNDVDYHAMVYNGTPGSGGAVFNLGTLGTGTRSWAYAINSSGQIAGWSDTAGTTGQTAFLYTGTPGAGGTMTSLGALGGSTSLATGINATGQIAGSASTGSTLHAFLYTGTPGVDGHMYDLGTLAGGPRSEGAAVNDRGQVVGLSYLFSGSNTVHAFLYTGTPGSGGHMSDLGTIGRGTSSNAAAVNNLGHVVGSSHTTGGTQHAMIYTGTPGIDGKMIDLDAWLDVNNPVEGAKWTLTGASDLTDTDQIVGLGTYNDDTTTATRAFLLDASILVPEPVSLAIPVVAALSLRRPKRPPPD